jgi:hypothetical protein
MNPKSCVLVGVLAILVGFAAGCGGRSEASRPEAEATDEQPSRPPDRRPDFYGTVESVSENLDPGAMGYLTLRITCQDVPAGRPEPTWLGMKHRPDRLTVHIRGTPPVGDPVAPGALVTVWMLLPSTMYFSKPPQIIAEFVLSERQPR